MVYVDIPARIACGEPGCTRSMKAQLALCQDGGLTFAPMNPEQLDGWSLGGQPTPRSVIAARCPQHKPTNLAIPDRGKLITGEAH